jgi:hypothetical protein
VEGRAASGAQGARRAWKGGRPRAHEARGEHGGRAAPARRAPRLVQRVRRKRFRTCGRSVTDALQAIPHVRKVRRGRVSPEAHPGERRAGASPSEASACAEASAVASPGDVTVGETSPAAAAGALPSLRGGRAGASRPARGRIARPRRIDRAGALRGEQAGAGRPHGTGSHDPGVSLKRPVGRDSDRVRAWLGNSFPSHPDPAHRLARGRAGSGVGTEMRGTWLRLA